ncbi:hypothetical protein DFH06DRAFT_1011292 [Mycena polygramma]|nr:hypothetical protein DFH06DRAFT_1011292 [Mycena polygramma]
MSNTKFKITKDGVTRRVTFSSQPSWNALAARIHTLFDIPIDKIGVSYIDADSDEVTLSSEDELRDYYQAFPANEVTKFVVHDLTRNEKALPDTPRSTAFRNTFGIDNEGLGIEDDWQPLNLGGGVFVTPLGGSDSPQAHIETVDSDSIHDHSDVSEDESDDSTTDFGHVTFTRDKGKAKAVDPSPAPSVAADSNSEEPILFETQATRFPDTPVRSVSSVFEPVSELKDEPQEASTPKAAPLEAEDPPLPTIDPTPTPQPSLTNDVATLLTTLSNVVSTHPELSEGLRNIIQNATNGIYWNSHRASMSQAAGDFVQATGEAATDLRRRAEEEAGQRVAEAIGSFVRSFSQVLGGAADTSAAEPAAAAASAEDHDHPWRTSAPPAGFNSSSFWYGAPPPMWAGAGTRGRGGRRGSWGGPHHGPPFHHGPHPMPGPHGGPPPGAPRGFGPFPPPRGPAGSWPQFGQWGPPPLVDTSTNEKAPEPAAPTVAYPVSAGNAKVGYPPLEMYSVPHRSKTYHGRPTRRHNHEDIPETASERTINRITKRLAAMGITDKAHPSLPAKIKEQLPAEGTISEETENNIVSTLVEELLFMSPKPAASGSGLRDADHEVPGAWP